MPGVVIAVIVLAVFALFIWVLDTLLSLRQKRKPVVEDSPGLSLRRASGAGSGRSRNGEDAMTFNWNEMMAELVWGGGGFGGTLDLLDRYRERVMRARASTPGYDSVGRSLCDGLEATDWRHSNWQFLSRAKSWREGKAVKYENCGRCGRTRSVLEDA